MTRRDRMIVGVLLSVIAVVVAWLAIIQPKRNLAASLGTQLASAQSQLASAEASVSAARGAVSSYPSNYQMVVRLGEAVPSDDDVPSLIYQIQDAASRTKVDFRSLTVQGGTTSAAPATAAGAAGASSSTTPPGVTVGPSGLPAMGFQFTFNGSFFDLSSFFGALQSFVKATPNSVAVSGRLMTLNSFSLAPGAGGFPAITATMQATSYLLPKGETPASSQSLPTTAAGTAR